MTYIPEIGAFAMLSCQLKTLSSCFMKQMHSLDAHFLCYTLLGIQQKGDSNNDHET